MNEFQEKYYEIAKELIVKAANDPEIAVDGKAIMDLVKLVLIDMQLEIDPIRKLEGEVGE